MKTALAQEQEVKQAQEQGSKLFLFLSLALVGLLQHFFRENGNIKQEQGMFLSYICYKPIKALDPGSFVVLPRSQRQKKVLKKGFQKRCGSSLLIAIMVRFIRYKELAFVSALVLSSLVKTRLN